MNYGRTYALAFALLAVFAGDASAKNAAGSAGARHQGAAHHNNAAQGVTIEHRRGTIDVRGPAYINGIGTSRMLTPAYDAHGRVLAPVSPAYQGELSAITEALTGRLGSEKLYRAEMCRVLPSLSDQSACFHGSR